MNKEVLEYVDEVMSRVNVPDENKAKLENELIRRIIRASGSASVDKVINELGSPKELADEMCRKSTCEVRKHDKYTPPRYMGEYMREESDVNIKLLYIPLIQISSGTERIRMPIEDNCYFY